MEHDEVERAQDLIKKSESDFSSDSATNWPYALRQVTYSLLTLVFHLSNRASSTYFTMLLGKSHETD